MSTTTRPGGYFITGTDTEIGKTHISCALAMGLVQQGYSVAPRKPIASGCIKQADGSLLSEDAYRLQQASQTKDSLQTICPYQFEAAISPARAIQQSGQTIGLDDLVQACQAPSSEFLLVEGAGGFLSPLSDDALNADLAKQLALPIILVVGNRLGCINHALLTLEAIQQRHLTLAAIVLNDLSQQADPNNLIDLKNKLPNQQLIHHPYQTQLSPIRL
ncbi:MAG: dethiobiotin synthase [Thiomicrospira sp.]|uniref:dethiobiotin synthase n=1 Tax=Thiomicrospira sp. TaxID=935 RepID=UPI001A0B5B8A|nr:dethiobiotin synthase [Thiomicrospira sp.]MBE0492704.1 dethiobiotin synthase [Thiomicrospira sp.]